MTPDEALLADWVALIGRVDKRARRAAEVGADLMRRWSEPQRRYHTLDHLRLMLSVVDAHASAADDADPVRLAAWFHDAVYEPRDSDNEARSAKLAAGTLHEMGVPVDLIAEVVRLVWLTTTHRVEPGDRNGALLCDADLAVLATAAYDDYARDVRAEYGFVPDDAFRAGRAAILRKLLEQPQLYRVPALHAAWEAPAREHLSAELAALTAPPDA